jgi:hypothetical protein
MMMMMILQKAKYMHRLARKLLYQALQIVCIFASLNHQPSSCLHAVEKWSTLSVALFTGN